MSCCETGTAVLDCVLHRNCSVTSWLSGCHELVPCAVPSAPAVDGCVFDFVGGNCTGLMGGETCEVRCRWSGPKAFRKLFELLWIPFYVVFLHFSFFFVLS